MRGLLVVILVATAVLVGPLPAASAQVGTSAINVVSAIDHGCSGDKLSSADMRVTVRVDGTEVLRTQKAQDEQEPLFAHLVTGIDAAGGVAVTIDAWEAEPGGSFGFGTVWESCDTDPGPGRSHTFQWHGEDRVVTTRGDAGDAAEVVVVLGSGAPAVPTLAVSELGPTSAKVSWPAPPGAGAHRVMWGDAGDVIATLGPEATSHVVTGLCENSDHLLRVVRDQVPWHVGSADLSVRTANGAPAAPRILLADPTGDGGSWNMSVELPSHRDLQRLEVHHGASADFEPGASTLVQEVSTPVWDHVEEFAVAAPATTGYVRLRAVDQGGLSSLSEGFALGGPHRAAGPPQACDGGWYQSAGFGGPGTMAPATEEESEPDETDLTGGTASPAEVRDGVADTPRHDGSAAQDDGSAARSSGVPWTSPVAIAVAVGAVVVFLAVVIGLSVRRR